MAAFFYCIDMVRCLRFGDLGLDRRFEADVRRPDFAFPTHSHDYHEAFICLEGQGVHELNGDLLDLEPGDLWFVGPGDVHSIRPRHEFVFAKVGWPCPPWRQWLELAGLTGTGLAKYAVAPHLESRFRRVAECDPRGGEAALELCLFWGDLAATLRRPSTLEARPDWMLRAARAMESEAGLREGWPLLLSSAHVSASHLCREWRRHFGVTPTEWINARRLENAVHLLLQSNLSIREIQARCGFPNTAYFYRLFGGKYGMAPQAYRRTRLGTPSG